FVAQKYSAIFLNPADSRAAGEGVKKAHAAGIPVFTFDVQVADEEAKALVVSHIGSDNYQGGRLAAESMMEVTADRGKIAIISYPEISSCIFRVQGFRDYLKEHHSQLDIVTELSGKGNRNDGYATATDVLHAHPDSVAIFGVNDPSALGAYAAVVKAGRQDRCPSEDDPDSLCALPICRLGQRRVQDQGAVVEAAQARSVQGTNPQGRRCPWTRTDH
ncbi:MAG: substrate-binding domain-containing protein, partial [Acidobacteriota bacterium]